MTIPKILGRYRAKQFHDFAKSAIKKQIGNITYSQSARNVAERYEAEKDGLPIPEIRYVYPGRLELTEGEIINRNKVK